MGITSEIYSGLYFGQDTPHLSTLKKAMLIYDELHFLDKPSFNIGGGGEGSIGTIGKMSYMRNPVKEFIDNGIIIKCHDIFWGPLTGPLKESVNEDLRDRKFVLAFINAFLNDDRFCSRFLQLKGKYNYVFKNPDLIATGFEIREAMKKIGWNNITFDIEKLELPGGNLLFNPHSQKSLENTMSFFLCEASHLLNSSLFVFNELSSVPYTDFAPFHKLLLIKGERLSDGLTAHDSKAKMMLLSNCILDEILQSEVVAPLTFIDIIKYRNKHRDELSEFRQYMRKIQYSIESEKFNDKFERELKKLIEFEIYPKVKEYKDELKKSWEDLFGAIVTRGSNNKEIITFSALILIGAQFGTLPTIGVSGISIAAWVAPPIVDFINSRRRIKRNNSLTYLLDL